MGLLDENEKIKEIVKIKLKSGLHSYSLNSGYKPAKIELDPYYWYIAENRNASLIKEVKYKK